MSQTKNPPNFNNYLKSKYASKGTTYTHTRIGDTASKIHGGSYNIPENERNKFWQIYYNHVLKEANLEYLTEKQLIDNGPILVDIDLRYGTSITSRQHSKEHIQDAVVVYGEEIDKLLQVEKGVQIPVFVMEKPNVNRLDTKTKDGIHIIIGIQMHKALQLILREQVLPELRTMWDDLPLENCWEDILDEGISKGHTNWQMYGSRKPNHEAYKLKYYFKLEHDGSGWEIEEMAVNKFNIETNFQLLSAQYRNHIAFNIRPEIEELFNKRKSTFNKKIKNYKLKITSNLQNSVPFDKIDSEKTLDSMIETQFEDVLPASYILKETHQYTMTLPKCFWGPGSYNKWIRVAWALANTDRKLFLTWLKFSSQSSEFNWEQVPTMWAQWNDFLRNPPPECLTHRSILYWSKEEAPDDYKKVREETIGYFIDQTITTATEFDIAVVLHQLFKHEFVCVSIKNNIWYEYIKHRWIEIDSGSTLRLLISKDMHEIYMAKTQDLVNKMQTMDQADVSYELIRKRSNKLADICVLLKKTTWKNNIMREARELFYDKEFMNKLDANPYLLCCKNVVVDIKNKTCRRGRPDDYLSKSTNIDYEKLDKKKNATIIKEINAFMAQLFPVKELRTYMWQHLASCCVGTNENQTFTMYTGDGRNGKSILINLMGKILGDYKGTVPITLITQKRNSIGSTSSEIVQLMGIRLAVMQEPSKGERLKEGILKEITGGDPLQGRALFKDAVTFIPQFTLVVCTNVLLEIDSNEDGTWRRIRKVDYMSKFLENPYGEEGRFPKKDYPYQFKINKKLENNFPRWAPVMLAMLIEIVFETQGLVKDCNIVVASSDEYRTGQDYLAEFAKENIIEKADGRIKKMELMEHFSGWYKSNFGKAVPKGRELYSFINKKYGNYRSGGWQNIAIIYDEGDEVNGC